MRWRLAAMVIGAAILAGCERKPCPDGGAADGPVFRLDVALDLCNARPNVQVSGNRIVSKGSTVDLDAGATADPNGDPISFAWRVVSVPEGGKPVTLQGAALPRVRFVAADAGRYVLGLTVSDGELSAESTPVEVIVMNDSPTASAGVDQLVPLAATVRLDGSLSDDPNGDQLTYAWRVVSAPPASQAVLTAPTNVVTEFQPQEKGRYDIELTVSDGLASASDTVAVLAGVSANAPVARIVNVPAAQSLGARVTLDGTASSDADGDPLTYAWQLLELPAASTTQIRSSTAASTSIVLDVPGGYRVGLVVNDGFLDSQVATLSLQVGGNPSPSPSPSPSGPPTPGSLNVGYEVQSSSIIFRGIGGTGPNDMYLAGEGGTLLHWNGNVTESVTMGTDVTQFVNDVWMGSPNFGVAVGLTTVVWDGRTWSPPDLSAVSSASELAHVWGSGLRDVWAVGSFAKAHWDGASWTDVDLTALGLSALYFSDVWGSAANDVWLVGRDSVGGLALHWNGAAWSVRRPPVPGEITSVHGSSPTNAWFTVLNEGVWRWDGTNFVPLPPLEATQVWVTSETDAWAVTTGGAFRFDGVAWQSVFRAFGGFTVVWGTSPSNVWLTGDTGVTLRWDGAAWTLMAGQFSDLGRNARAISVLGTADLMFSSGDFLFQWDGSALRAIPTPGDVGCLWRPSRNEGWLCKGSRILHWVSGRFEVAGLPAHNVFPTEIWGTSANQVWAASAGGLFRYDGNVWTRENLGPDQFVRSIHGTGPNDVWAVGPGTILHWNGMSWTLVASPRVDVLNVYAATPTAAWIATGGENVLRWDGSAWNPELVVRSTRFVSVGGLGPNNVWLLSSRNSAHFDGTAWTLLPPLLGEADGRIGGLGLPNGPLMVAGDGTVMALFGDSWWRAFASPFTMFGNFQVDGTGRPWIGGVGVRTRIDGIWYLVDADGTASWTGSDNRTWIVGQAGRMSLLVGSVAQTIPPLTTRALRDVWGTAPNNVWAAGDGGTLIHFDGQSWSVRQGTQSEALGRNISRVRQTASGDLFLLNAIELEHIVGSGSGMMEELGGSPSTELEVSNDRAYVALQRGLVERDVAGRWGLAYPGGGLSLGSGGLLLGMNNDLLWATDVLATRRGAAWTRSYRTGLTLFDVAAQPGGVTYAVGSRLFVRMRL